MNFVPPEEPLARRVIKPRKMPAKSVLVIAVVVVLVASAGGTTWAWNATRTDQIIPHVSIFGVPVGGLSGREAARLVERTLEKHSTQSIRIRFQGNIISLGSAASIINYQTQEAIMLAQQLGHTGPLPKRLVTSLAVKMFGYRLNPTIVVDRRALQTLVNQAMGEELHGAQNARLIIEATDTTSTIRVESDKTGIRLHFQDLADDIQQAALASPSPIIEVTADQEAPTITNSDLTPLVAIAEGWLEHAPFTLTVENTHWTVKREDLARWMQVATSTHPPTLILDPQGLITQSRLHIKDLLKTVHDGRIVIDTDGKAAAFEAPEEGFDVDGPSTIEHILRGWEAGSSTIALAMTRIEPKILGDGERLGIHEVVGIGKSTFSGSPTNRRKNIALGAQKVHLTLVPAGEEFSMLKTLGTIDGEHGWLPELVIKGNKTTPEFGGGLCQVGTTMFRAALAGGFPITERRNHSYRVRYYEPAGTDATIYDPAPDFRFKNDLIGSILVTTRVQGDNLVFTIWGKKDGRSVVQTASRVSNIVAAPPKKVIETLDLKPGEEKCTEKEHAGADAQFDYTVTYPDSTVVKKTFFSRYKPWQAVCLKGVEALTKPVEGVDQTGVNNPNL